MYPHSHALFPLLVGLILEKLGYVGYEWVLVAVLVGVLIDVDHLLKHFLLTGSLSIRGTWNAGVVKHEQDRTFIHHRNGMIVTTLLLIVAAAYWPYWITAVMLGYFSHMFLDHFSVTRGFVDYITDYDFWGAWKPIHVELFGFLFAFARHEIVLDVVMIIGVIGVLTF